MSNFGFWDAGERTALTVAESALALALAQAARWSPWVGVVLAGALAAVKTTVALKYGNGTASFLPARVEPRPPDMSRPPA